MLRRKAWLCCLGSICLWVAAGCAFPKDGESGNQAVERPSPDRLVPATVVRVIDGDTFEASMEGRREKVRLIGVNTPETKHPKLGAQRYGKEASRFTKERLEGKRVELEFDVEKRDRYGRLLAYVWLGDEMFNAVLLREGMAQVMTVPPNVKHQEVFVKLQRMAREEKAGLWKIDSGEKSEKEQVSSDRKECVGKIKGNINREGERIYHLPGGRHYEITRPERWFCTEGEARAAGFRPAAQ